MENGADDIINSMLGQSILQDLFIVNGRAAVQRTILIQIQHISPRTCVPLLFKRRCYHLEIPQANPS